MKRFNPEIAARAAVAASPGRPAVSVLHDCDDGRLVVFRLGPGQRVAPHTSVSSVFMTVVSGAGFVTGAEGELAVTAGETVTFAPRELHGMRADDHELVLAAVIAPRPGGR